VRRPAFFFVAGAFLACVAFPAAANTIVRFDTSLGVFDVELYDNDTPITVQNFLNYVQDGDYEDSFFHRLVPGFVLQGGGFIYKAETDTFYFVPTDPPIVNEFMHSNVRGTIAMAKQAGNPDSATSQFFFNLADNSANLDTQNGGFTVFGHVLGDGMQVVDRLAGAPPNLDNVGVWDASGFYSAFGELPLIDYQPSEPFPPYLEMVHNIAVLLGWENAAGNWNDPLWFDGNQLRSPAGREALVVRSGEITVDSPLVDSQVITSLSVEGGLVNILSGGELAVSETVSVGETSVLLVDGRLGVGRQVASQGTLAGSGTIVAPEVIVSGTFSPGGQQAASRAGMAAQVSAVPEPAALLLLCTAGLAWAGMQTARRWKLFPR